MAKTNKLNEILKSREESEKKDINKPMALDDAQRVKVLSPTRLILKRFFRNKLAIVGMCILVIMFAVSFLGPLFYPYGQTMKFDTVKSLTLDYAVCGELTSYSSFMLEKNDAAEKVKNYMDSFILDMEKEGSQRKEFTKDDSVFVLEKAGKFVYKLFVKGYLIGSCDKFTGKIASGTISEELAAQVKNALDNKQDEFEFEGNLYSFSDRSKTSKNIFVTFTDDNLIPGIISTKFVFNPIGTMNQPVDEFKIAALEAIYGDGSFEAEGKKYTFRTQKPGEYSVYDEEDNEVLFLSEFSIKNYDGTDSLPRNFKDKMTEVVLKMEEEGARTATFTFDVPQLDAETMKYLTDEDGNLLLETEELYVNRKEVAGKAGYYAGYDMNKQVIDTYDKPSEKHILGTDGDGYDVFARIMYGGRISLIVGFVVVILETILGVIMGGIAGFFGGWVDTLIMRLVDIFYCIPTMPIMIILASLFDEMKMPPYERLMWMMVMLGVLGWAGVARLVRGQILSLREQEFMVAAEATGIKTSRRIFRHLVPNVMPQLIVSMTMGLGSVILTESTLSYLGLGVKHPLATWGNIINSVSSIEAMKNYTYIWIPVGILICLTVIAFNFVGDGLRDAFDPKMKR